LGKKAVEYQNVEIWVKTCTSTLRDNCGRKYKPIRNLNGKVIARDFDALSFFFPDVSTRVGPRRKCVSVDADYFNVIIIFFFALLDKFNYKCIFGHFSSF